MLEKSIKVVSLNPSGITILPDRRKLRQKVVDELAESIEQQGLINAITVRPKPGGRGGGYILIAGHHRLMAIRKLKRDSISAVVLHGLVADEATLIEIDENLIRADLSPAEHAMFTRQRLEIYEKLHGKAKAIGADATHRKLGRKHANAKLALAFTTETAKKTGQSKRKVQRDATRGKRLRKVLSDVVGTSLDKGEELDALGALSEAEQKKLVKAAKSGKKVSAKTRAKQVRRDEREKVLDKQQRALPDKTYGVIVADPEWRFEPWSRITGLDRAADNHYPTSVLDVIKSRQVEKIAAKDCVLFLWATTPMLPHALLVIAAWGFDYKSHYVWVKNKAGTGYWNREKHELLLIGTRGKIPAPAPGKQQPSVITADRTQHSAKPVAAMKMIESYYPRLRKIELNCRGKPRPGWEGWGLESEV